jgi:hypothetical protein
VRLLDATVVSEPGKTGSQWRVHYSLTLPTLECDHFVLMSTAGAGVAERFGQFRFFNSDLVLADAGYSNPPGILAIVERHADVCVRLNPHALPLYDGGGKRFKLSAELSQIATVEQLPSGRFGFMLESGKSPAASRRFARVKRLFGERIYA